MNCRKPSLCSGSYHGGVASHVRSHYRSECTTLLPVLFLAAASLIPECYAQVWVIYRDSEGGPNLSENLVSQPFDEGEDCGVAAHKIGPYFFNHSHVTVSLPWTLRDDQGNIRTVINKDKINWYWNANPNYPKQCRVAPPSLSHNCHAYAMMRYDIWCPNIPASPALSASYIVVQGTHVAAADIEYVPAENHSRRVLFSCWNCESRQILVTVEKNNCSGVYQFNFPGGRDVAAGRTLYRYQAPF